VTLRLLAVALLALAVALAVLLPPLLARAAWPSRAPRAALVAWQAVGLGGGLAILGAGLTLAASSLSPHWVTGIAAIPGHLGALGPVGWIGVVLTVLAGGWLIAVLVASTLRLTRTRRRHRERLDLVANDTVVDAGSLVGIRLLEHDAAVAYCLPGLRPQIVLSRGTLESLPPAELTAVVLHEQAHARGRHDLVIHPFRAWRETFSFLRPATQALGAVELLVEMLADDAARRGVTDAALRAALVRLAADHPDDADLNARIARLTRPAPPLPRLIVTLVYAASLVLVVAPPVILALT
jgi:Zn-dependent protease with chaperone function